MNTGRMYRSKIYRRKAFSLEGAPKTKRFTTELPQDQRQVSALPLRGNR